MTLGLASAHRFRPVWLELFLVLLMLGTSAVGIPATAAVGAPGAATATESVVVLLLVDRSAESVTTAWRRSLAEGLSEAAASQGVVLCSAEQDRPGCARSALPDAPRLEWRVSTSITVKSFVAFINVPLSLEVVTERDLPVPEAGLFVVEDTVVLPEEGTSDGRDSILARHVAEIVRNHSALRRWFAEIRAVPGLESQAPRPSVAPETGDEEHAEHAEVGPSLPTPDEAAHWQREEEQILEMLIDDRFGDARRAADRLLEDERLPAAARDRVRRLRQTAVEREAAQVEPEPPQPTEPDEAPDPRPPEPPFDYTFKVRVAEAGRGFLRGTDGRLRLFDRGISFVPNAREKGDAGGGEGWFLRWSELRHWGEAEGLWDISHPLQVSLNEGESIYFAVLDQEGRFRPGDKVLSLLSRGAERARQR